jgi:hypothetical protein
MPERSGALTALADEAQVEVWVASRTLSTREQTHLRRIHDAWLRRWISAFGCPASRSQVVLDGCVLVWGGRARRVGSLVGSMALSSIRSSGQPSASPLSGGKP